MEQYKKDFIDFMVECQVLRFGDFVTKSGRQTPFFVNTGYYRTGEQLKKLGEYYAHAIQASFGTDFDILFGPAYKGIPLSVATVIAYSRLYNKEIRYCSNRKEEKDHGADKGMLLGSDIKKGDRIVIIEDVTTSGKSIDETVPVIYSQVQDKNDITIVGEMVSLNRMEKAQDTDKSALDSITDRYGFPARAIVSMNEVIDDLYIPGNTDKIISDGIITDGIKKEIDAYYKEWGAK